QIEDGWALSDALSNNAGVATPQTILAATVGEATGRLAPCLRSLPGRDLGPLWLEVIPRFLYPLLLVINALFVIVFLSFDVVPKFEKIFFDFKLQLPALTESLIGFSRWIVSQGLILAFLGID